MDLQDEQFDEGDFGRDVRIDLDDLNRVICAHPVLFYRYGKLARVAEMRDEKLKIEIGIAKRQYDRVLAQQAEKIRADYAARGERVTVDQIKNEALISPASVEAEKTLDDMTLARVEAGFERGILELAERVFAKRGDLLNTLGWSVRAENRSEFEVPRAREKSEDFVHGAEADIASLRDRMKRAVAATRRREE